MLHDSIVAAIRTGVAALAGLLITVLVDHGVNFPDDTQAQLSSVLFILATGGYNAVVILLERRVNPLFGILLGVPRTPSYQGATAPLPGAVIDEGITALDDPESLPPGGEVIPVREGDVVIVDEADPAAGINEPGPPPVH